MCPVRREHLILCGVLAIAPGVIAQSVPTPPAETALRDAGMLDVLEARLLDELEQSGDDAERGLIIDRLAEVYAALLRQSPTDSPQRSAVAARAWDLADRAGEDRAVELRLALLLDAYLPVERAAELHELDLLSEADRVRASEELGSLNNRLRRMARTAVTRAELAGRLARSGDDPTRDAAFAEEVRRRSLAHYYAAWSGLNLAVLENRRVDNEVLPSFGWLLGTEGETPALDRLNDASLDLEHVARSALGVGRVRARDKDFLLAEQWFTRVAESDQTPVEIRRQAEFRLLRVIVDQGEWLRAAKKSAEVRASAADPEPLPTAEARYLAVRVLEHLTRSPTDERASELLRAALQDLVERGEIGHVLDLRDRFGRLADLGSGFIAEYASALDQLSAAEQSGSGPMFAEASARFGRAAKATDASRFWRQREDALLKQVYCELRAGQPRRAVEMTRTMLASEIDPDSREEARWLLIVSLDETKDPALGTELAEAVRAYLADYPETVRAHKLLVRHAGTPTLDPDQTLEGLRTIPESDPVVINARRVLARMVYRAWTAGRRQDHAARAELAELARWIWEREDADPKVGTPRERLDLARIALDVALSATPRDDELADTALARCRRLVAEPGLAIFRPEIDLRTTELLAARNDLSGAETAARPLHESASDLAAQADRFVLAAAFRVLDQTPGEPTASEMVLRVGVRVADRLTPPAPTLLPPEASAIIDRVAQVVASSASAGAPASRDTAIRLGRLLIERGSPTAQGLRDLARLAAEAGQTRTELDAWNILLTAARPEEEAWWEARYHTLRLLTQLDPQAGRAAFEQHRVLYPMPGLLPWTRLITELFAGKDTQNPPAEPSPG